MLVTIPHFTAKKAEAKQEKNPHRYFWLPSPQKKVTPFTLSKQPLVACSVCNR